MPRDDEDEKEMEARFARETATAEEWVDVVVDVVGGSGSSRSER